jgi:hypothetical protein
MNERRRGRACPYAEERITTKSGTRNVHYAMPGELFSINIGPL